MYLGGKRRWRRLVVENAASFFLFFSGGGGERIPLKFVFTIYVALKVVIKSLDIEHPHH